jgi:hypothetical protein
VCKFRLIARSIFVSWILVGLSFLSLQAAELKPETIDAFDRYIRATELRMDDDLRNKDFFYEDRLPDDIRLRKYAQLKAGELNIEQLHTMESGSFIPIPSGLIHHWTGTAFIPGVTYAQVLNILLDYERQEEIYKPDVQRSKLLESDGIKSKIHLRFFKKSLVTAVLNADFNAEYRRLNNSRGEIRSYSTRIAEVRNPGAPNEEELPVGNDHGYLWRMDSYWRIEEKDGGVYLQVETVALSRRIPLLLAWFINPTIKNLSREVIANMLTATRQAVGKYQQRSHETVVHRTIF